MGAADAENRSHLIEVLILLREQECSRVLVNRIILMDEFEIWKGN